jgi:hypothetical protein
LPDQSLEVVAIAERLTDELLGSFFCGVAHGVGLLTSKP